jgi:hypothetical protein
MSDRKIAKIERLYHDATAATVEKDLAQAVEILKTLPDEDTRARAAVFMDGLSQMRSEWRLEQKTRGKKTTRGR